MDDEQVHDESNQEGEGDIDILYVRAVTDACLYNEEVSFVVRRSGAWWYSVREHGSQENREYFDTIDYGDLLGFLSQSVISSLKILGADDMYEYERATWDEAAVTAGVIASHWQQQQLSPDTKMVLELSCIDLGIFLREQRQQRQRCIFFQTNKDLSKRSLVLDCVPTFSFPEDDSALVRDTLRNWVLAKNQLDVCISDFCEPEAFAAILEGLAENPVAVLGVGLEVAFEDGNPLEQDHGDSLGHFFSSGAGMEKFRFYPTTMTPAAIRGLARTLIQETTAVRSIEFHCSNEEINELLMSASAGGGHNYFQMMLSNFAPHLERLEFSYGGPPLTELVFQSLLDGTREATLLQELTIGSCRFTGKQMLEGIFNFIRSHARLIQVEVDFHVRADDDAFAFAQYHDILTDIRERCPNVSIKWMLDACIISAFIKASDSVINIGFHGFRFSNTANQIDLFASDKLFCPQSLGIYICERTTAKKLVSCPQNGQQ